MVAGRMVLAAARDSHCRRPVRSADIGNPGKKQYRQLVSEIAKPAQLADRPDVGQYDEQLLLSQRLFAGLSGRQRSSRIDQRRLDVGYVGPSARVIDAA